MTTAAIARAPLDVRYWKLFAAHAVSNLGDGVCAVAFPWLASAITRDPMQLALVALATRLPWLVFVLPAGVLIDRVDRRRLVIACNAMQTVGLLLLGTTILAARDGLAAHPARYLAVLFGAALAFGALEVVRDTATQTLVPALVPPRELHRANARLMSAELITNSFLGNPIGGALVAFALAVPFYADAAAFAVATALVAAIGASAAAARPVVPRAREPLGKELAAGFRWLVGEPTLRAMSLSLCGFNTALGAALGTFTLYAQEVLHLDAAGLGLLMTGAAVGSFISGWTSGTIIERLGPGAVVQLGILGSGVAFGVLALTSAPVIAWAMFVAYSLVAMPWSTLSRSLRQRLTPDGLLGRATSAHRMLAWGMLPVGNLIGGAAAAFAGRYTSRETALRIPLALASIAMIAIALYARRRLSTARLAAVAARTE